MTDDYTRMDKTGTDGGCLMMPFYERDGITLYVGDNRDVLPLLDGISAVVTDPPYGLSFMGKDWDHEVPGVAFWEAMREAMLPGAHLLSFGGTRTFHRIAVAIEDAGFELRDTLMWLYGSGFPKSHDVSKAIDKAAGAERKVIGKRDVGPDIRGDNFHRDNGDRMVANITEPATPEAERWQGWGTALKPSYEPVICARKPLIGTVAANILQHGTGALNIDGCRIGTDDTIERGDFDTFTEAHDGYTRPNKSMYTHKPKERSGPANSAGRWPANVVLDEDAAAALDAQSGERKSGSGAIRKTAPGLFGMGGDGKANVEYGDTGGASRFFYVAKASRKERGEGNNHPTVKPLALMRYLVRLVTPPGGVILDPFAGSGSTLVAAARLGINAIGIELSEEYAEIAARRIDAVLSANRQPKLPLEIA